MRMNYEYQPIYCDSYCRFVIKNTCKTYRWINYDVSYSIRSAPRPLYFANNDEIFENADNFDPISHGTTRISISK